MHNWLQRLILQEDLENQGVKDLQGGAMCRFIVPGEREQNVMTCFSFVTDDNRGYDSFSF
jgi:hypothetical protein